MELNMADINSKMLCDYDSSVDESADERVHKTSTVDASNKTNSNGSKQTSSSDSSSSDEKGVQSYESKIMKVPRQYRRNTNSMSPSKRKSKSPERGRLTHHSHENPDHVYKRKNSKDRSHRRHRDSRHHSSRHSRRRRGRSRSRSSHRREKSNSRSSHRRRHRDNHHNKLSKHSRSRKEKSSLNSGNIGSKTFEPAKPIDPVFATQQVAAKASAMMASAMNRNGSDSSVSNLDPKEIWARIQEHQGNQAKLKAEAAANAANLPKYYNPLSVNVAKMAEQQQKRKLLWSKRAAVDPNEDPNSKMWKTTSMVAGRGDSAATAKFCKLMGIHDAVAGGNAFENQNRTTNDDETVKEAQAQAELFQRLEREYEVSRTLTHTQRGVGLGYAAAVDYSAYAAMKNSSGGNENH